jgi:hypothetical protein
MFSLKKRRLLFFAGFVVQNTVRFTVFILEIPGIVYWRISFVGILYVNGVYTMLYSNATTLCRPLGMIKDSFIYEIFIL